MKIARRLCARCVKAGNELHVVEQRQFGYRRERLLRRLQRHVLLGQVADGLVVVCALN